MPQASRQTLADYMELGGTGPEDDGFASDYLHHCGWTLTDGFSWIPPAGLKSLYDITSPEWVCMDFLSEEWDYGGIDEEHYLRLVSVGRDDGGSEVRGPGVMEDVEGMSEQGDGVCEVCDAAPDEQCDRC